ncbi:UNVERIFIED_CONTAM: hypothetical protein K2H54_019639 [Gekko kuhli]
MVSEHMLRLYDRYSGRPDGSAPGAPQALHHLEGNTVRSFRALPAGSNLQKSIPGHIPETHNVNIHGNATSTNDNRWVT